MSTKTKPKAVVLPGITNHKVAPKPKPVVLKKISVIRDNIADAAYAKYDAEEWDTTPEPIELYIVTMPNGAEHRFASIQIEGPSELALDTHSHGCNIVGSVHIATTASVIGTTIKGKKVEL